MCVHSNSICPGGTGPYTHCVLIIFIYTPSLSPLHPSPQALPLGFLSSIFRFLLQTVYILGFSYQRNHAILIFSVWHAYYCLNFLQTTQMEPSLWPEIASMYHAFLIYLSVDKPVGCYQDLAVMSCAACKHGHAGVSQYGVFSSSRM